MSIKAGPLIFNGPEYDYSVMHQAYLHAKSNKQKYLRYNAKTIDIDPARTSQIIVNGKGFDVK